VILALLCALGAMALFGVASVLQALATSRAADMEVLDPRLLLRLARQPVFLAALSLNVLGFLLHITALQTLPLFLVQAVIAGSVAVTAVLSVRVFGVRLSRGQWGAVALVVLGLVLLAPTATEGDAVTPGAREPLVLLAGVVAVFATAVAVRRVPGSTGAVLLGLLAGAGFGILAVCARLLPPYGVELLTAPVAYVLVLAGGTAYLVYSAAMQRGSVTTATAAMVITQTVVPAVAGLFLGDSVRAGLVPVAVAGFALALAGALALGRVEQLEPVAVGSPAHETAGCTSATCSGRTPARARRSPR
jgi:drug/metabolite transporter (DMT)-like permease